MSDITLEKLMRISSPEMRNHARLIAELLRVRYDSYIQAGFSESHAIMLTLHFQYLFEIVWENAVKGRGV
jgi:hypothetical protein